MKCIVPSWVAPSMGGGISVNPLLDYVGYWKFDEASGSFLDTSSNANHIPVFNAPGAAVGKVGGARSFLIASSQYGSLASNAVLERANKSWSINLWVYPTVGGAGAFRVVVAKDDNTPERTFDLGIRGDNNHFYINQGTTFAVAESTTACSIDTWYNVCFTFTTGSRAFVLYVNGVSEHSGTLASEFPASSATWQFGAGAGVGINNYDGRLDNCLLYDRVLTPSEVTDLYSSSVGMGL